MYLCFCGPRALGTHVHVCREGRKGGLWELELWCSASTNQVERLLLLPTALLRLLLQETMALDMFSATFVPPRRGAFVHACPFSGRPACGGRCDSNGYFAGRPLLLSRVFMEADARAVVFGGAYLNHHRSAALGLLDQPQRRRVSGPDAGPAPAHLAQQRPPPKLRHLLHLGERSLQRLDASQICLCLSLSLSLC